MFFNILQIPTLREIPTWKEISVKVKWTFLMELQMDTLGIRSKVSCSSFLPFFFLPAPRGESWFLLTLAAVKNVLGTVQSLPSCLCQLISQEQQGRLIVWEKLRHVPHSQGCLHSLRCLFSIFLLRVRTVPRTMNRTQILTPSLIGKSDVQINHFDGSIIRIKIEIQKRYSVPEI